jgi:hypothetical protein
VFPGRSCAKRAVSEAIGLLPVASWFETREDALLTMRVRDLILRSIAFAMRLEG